MKKITQNTKLSEILSLGEKAVEILFEAGLGCIGCPMAMRETLKQGAMAHGIDKKEIEKIIEKLNKLK
jgi:hybrid cluster-associated redox disulfide protein